MKSVIRTLLPAPLRFAANEQHSAIGERLLFIDSARQVVPSDPL